MKTIYALARINKDVCGGHGIFYDETQLATIYPFGPFLHLFESKENIKDFRRLNPNYKYYKIIELQLQTQ